MNTQEKMGLSVVEAGWLLQKTEAQVRGMLRRRELNYAVAGRRIQAIDVEGLLESGLARACLHWLLRGLIEAPRPATRWGKPADLFAALDALLLAIPALVVDEAGRHKIVPHLGTGNPDADRSPDGKRHSQKPVISFLL